MAGLDGLTILRAIKQERPSPGAVVLTADIDVNEAWRRCVWASVVSF
jgi:CheY-like chemotaxis protein